MGCEDRKVFKDVTCTFRSCHSSKKRHMYRIMWFQKKIPILPSGDFLVAPPRLQKFQFNSILVFSNIKNFFYHTHPPLEFPLTLCRGGTLACEQALMWGWGEKESLQQSLCDLNMCSEIFDVKC